MTLGPSRIVVPLATALFASALTLTGQQAKWNGPMLTAEEREILEHICLVEESDGGTGVVKTLRITGLNVQIVNGLGATDTANAHGNLILGYNEPVMGSVAKTGSHNLVGGRGNSFQSWGGLVTGQSNRLVGAFSW